jgi:transcription elongation factor
MNRRLKDKLQDKIVMIMKGEWKGFRGLVKHCDDKQATVEITSQKAKKIHINKDLLQLWDVNNMEGQVEETNQGGATVYDGGKTPMQYNTPSYYPHSPHWGTNQASIHGHDCKSISLTPCR